jgi:nucleoside-diphosphate-sugar epimerase
LRPRAIYGLGDRILLPRLLSMLKWDIVFCPISAHIKTSATHINNIAEAIALFLQQTITTPLRLYNIADTRVYGLRDMAVKSLCAIEGDGLKVLQIPASWLTITKRLSPVAIAALTTNSVLDISLIQKELGYQPVANFNESVAAIGEWINDLGGKNSYLKNIKHAPWMVSDILKN